MAESKVKDDNYFMVSGWMVNRLGLKGTALHLFAIIYGFSQDGEGSFTGSLQYLCDFTNGSKNTILKALKELVEKKYIVKTENTINGVRFCTYKTNAPVVQKLHWGGAETEPGVVQKLNQGGAETEPNNKDYNKSLKNKEIVKEVIDLYHSACVSFPSVKVISDARKKTVTAMLDKYGLDKIRTVFENAEASSFLKGSDGGWKASFDWLMKDANFIKVLEGNYADKPKYGKGRKEVVPAWCKDREPDEDERRAIQRMMGEDAITVGNDPELAARAERLRQQFQG